MAKLERMRQEVPQSLGADEIARRAEDGWKLVAVEWERESRETLGELLPPPSFEERIATALEHVCDLAQREGEDRAVRHLRGQLPHYLRGYPGAARLRDHITSADTIADVEATFALAREHFYSRTEEEIDTPASR